MKYLADPYEKLPAIVFWTMGSFHSVRWSDLCYAVPVVLLGMAVLMIFSWRLNLLSLGDEEAMSLGVNVKKTRFFFLFVSTLMVASSISIAGIVSWLALVVPHIGRYIVGSDHKILMPFSALVGGGLLLLMDTLARTITSSEIPISIITSLVGAPFLAYLLLRGREGAWGA
jgi:iron complex transport system permease protein